MIRYAIALLLAAAASAACAALPPNVEHVATFRGISEYRLRSNGMPILLVPQRASPVATFLVVYHVGSRDEGPGYTGSTHLLEHLMANKSTENYGRAHGRPTFFEMLYDAGAQTNMSVWNDRMTGYATVPSDRIELAMRIEAERMKRALLLDAERRPEMTVVRNEFEIGENEPWRALQKAVVASSMQAHPYRWHAIGYRSDIEGVSTEKLREHYKTYFWPNNAHAILVGDFDTEKALELFDRQYGGYARSPHEIPKVITVEPPQEGERRTRVKRPGTIGIVTIGYIRPGVMHPDFIPLEVLRTILVEGVNSRLYKALVDKGLATGVFGSHSAFTDPYPLLISANLAPRVAHADTEAAIKAVLAEIAANGVSDDEVRRAQQQIEVATLRRRDGPNSYAGSLAEAVASADWKWFLTYVDNVKAVTAADVKRVAAAHLVPDHATVGWFIPTSRAGRVTTAAAAASPQPRADASAPAVPAPAAPANKPFAERTVRKVLANGLTVAVVENRAVPTVSVRGLVFAGGVTAPAGKPALPALTARMLSRGTTTRSKEEIGALLASAGATHSYASTLTGVNVQANAMARDLSLVLEVLADELANPAFPADELVRARREQENAYQQAYDQTGLRALERLRQIVYKPDHPYYAYGRDEKLASLQALGESDLRAFHRARYNGSGTILAIVGDIDAAQAIALVGTHFGGMSRGERVSLAALARTAAADKGARAIVAMPGKANANVVVGTASGLRRLDADFEAALIANAALGQSTISSRIGRRVRDTEGLSYGVTSRFDNSDELDGVWLVNMNVAPQNYAKALQSTREVIADYVRNGATDAEVASGKSYFSGRYQVGLGSNGGIAEALVTAERFGFGPRYLDEFPQRVRAVTTSQVNAAIRKYFAADRLHVIVAGDVDER
ncbi:MAG TPA: pitrilysin family protein [Burkholderiales bacterium]|nr:pitrilysin family protein [Burkholderiales bacterium]